VVEQRGKEKMMQEIEGKGIKGRRERERERERERKREREREREEENG